MSQEFRRGWWVLYMGVWLGRHSSIKMKKYERESKEQFHFVEESVVSFCADGKTSLWTGRDWGHPPPQSAQRLLLALCSGVILGGTCGSHRWGQGQPRAREVLLLQPLERLNLTQFSRTQISKLIQSNQRRLWLEPSKRFISR